MSDTDIKKNKTLIFVKSTVSLLHLESNKENKFYLYKSSALKYPSPKLAALHVFNL